MKKSQMVPVTWDHKTLTAAAVGAVKIYQFGRRVPYKLTAEQWKRFEAAKTSGYVVLTRRAADDALGNCWWQWCCLEGAPYIKLQTRVKYASVEMDLINERYRLSNADVAALDRLVRPLLPASRWYLASIGHTYCHAQATIDNAHLIAWRFYETATRARIRAEPPQFP